MRSPDGDTSIPRASCMRRQDYHKWHLVNNTQSRISINKPAKIIYTYQMSHTVLELISMVCFIFAVIMQVNMPICDIFDISHDYQDVHHNIYTVT